MAEAQITKVGCSGFTVNRPQYYRTFPVVEVQQTFYEPPKPDLVKRWRAEAPAEFEFTLKAWQLITHEATSPTYRRLKTPLNERQRTQAGSFRYSDVVRRAWDTTLQVARLLRADKIIFQCPASFKPTEENEDNLRRFFGKIPRSAISCIWEPRGDWPADKIAALCEELELVHGVDPFKADCVTLGLRYYRLHGIGGYGHRFSDAELADVRRRTGGAPAYVLFNNVSMFQDAARFQKLVR